MSCPTEETVVIRDWSSLLADLVDLVGEHLLEDDDIDYYMDFCTVCKSWCKATKDPKEENCIDNGHFHPRKWILLDRRDDVLTFVNTETGRFIIKNMPLLHRYFFVGATSGGLIILDDQSTPPYHAHVLSPFTRLIAHFKARLPIGGVKDVVVTRDNITNDTLSLVDLAITSCGHIRIASTSKSF
jgi:hypothetical protein